MTRVLLDEDVPRGLAKSLVALGIDAAAFPNEWKQLSDGSLLDRAEAAGFDVLVTGDRNMPFQQSLAKRRLAVLILSPMERRSVLARAPRIAELATGIEIGRFSVLNKDGSSTALPPSVLAGTKRTN